MLGNYKKCRSHVLCCWATSTGFSDGEPQVYNTYSVQMGHITFSVQVLFNDVHGKVNGQR